MTIPIAYQRPARGLSDLSVIYETPRMGQFAISLFPAERLIVIKQMGHAFGFEASSKRTRERVFRVSRRATRRQAI